MMLNNNFAYNELYKRLNLFTLKCIKDKPPLIKEDIVHSAFIILKLNKLEFSFENMKQFIYDEIRAQSCMFSLSESLDQAINTNEIKNIFTGIDNKTCSTCKQHLSVSLFHKLRTLPNGVITYQAICKECQKQRNKINRQKKRLDPEYNKKFIEKAKGYREKRRSLIFNNDKIHDYFKNKWKLETRERRGQNVQPSIK